MRHCSIEYRFSRHHPYRQISECTSSLFHWTSFRFYPSQTLEVTWLVNHSSPSTRLKEMPLSSPRFPFLPGNSAKKPPSVCLPTLSSLYLWGKISLWRQIDRVLPPISIPASGSNWFVNTHPETVTNRGYWIVHTHNRYNLVFPSHTLPSTAIGSVIYPAFELYNHLTTLI